MDFPENNHRLVLDVGKRAETVEILYRFEQALDGTALGQIEELSDYLGEPEVHRPHYERQKATLAKKIKDCQRLTKDFEISVDSFTGALNEANRRELDLVAIQPKIDLALRVIENRASEKPVRDSELRHKARELAGHELIRFSTPVEETNLNTLANPPIAPQPDLGKLPGFEF